MKKITFVFLLLSMLSACKKDITKLNDDSKNPLNVPSYSLFTQGERLLANTVTSASVNDNIFRLIEQQWTETTYLNETLYQLNFRNQPDLLWVELYQTVLANLQRAKELIPKDVKDAKMQKNEIAIADILQVYTYYYLVTTFGNVPYTEALDINKTFPKFDDAKTIYYDLLTRLDADIAALDPSAESFGSADLIYGGDPASWKKFANTFKLKMGLTIADFDDAKAKAVVESAVAPANGGVFTSNDDNAAFAFVSAFPNTNPIWVSLVQSGRYDFVATSEFMALLKPGTSDADPRLPYYFAKNSSGVYLGADNGSGDGGIQYSDYSLPSGPAITKGSIGKLTNPDFPGLLLDYSETEFNLAEALERHYVVGGTTEQHYKDAITASIIYWGGTSAAATAYLTQANAAFATAPGATTLEKIAGQEYIALYNRGWDAWIMNRRLDYPKLVAPADAYTPFPVRFTYPIAEQNVNVVNYDQASAAIGGDKVTTKLFFDKH